MIRKMQYRFVLTASLVVLIVLVLVVGVINGAMRSILDMQTDRILSQLAYWDGNTDEEEKQTLHPELGTMLSNHFFRVLLDANGEVVALDLTNAVALNEQDARELASAAYEGGRSSGRLQAEDTLYAYQVSSHSEGGDTSMVFLDCTPAVNMVHELLLVSLVISAIALAGFVVAFSLLSKRAVRPLVRNMEGQKRFITNASHELKTPLAIISANTELLEAMNGESDWTRSITSQVRRMTGLVNELVTLSRLGEQNAVELRAVAFSALVTEAAEAIEPVVRQQGKTMTRDLASGVYAEGEDRLLQMLVNILLDNAAKYCDEGGTISLSLGSGGGKNVILSVSNDYASGKDVDYSRFFERFYQEDASHNSRNSGFGIGLSTAREIVELLKGSIRVSWRNGRIEFQTVLRSGRP